MRKLILLCLLLPFSLFAKTVYIGDSIAHGYRMFNHAEGITKVGASPKEVEKMLKQNPPGDKVVLSTGASNNCSDIKTIKANIALAGFLYKNVDLLSAPYCGIELNDKLKQVCKNNCTFIPVTPGKDGIHPDNYRKY